MTSAGPVVWVIPSGDGSSPDSGARDLAQRVTRPAVAHVLGVAPGDVAVGREPSGRPVLVGAHAGAAALSVTHTAGLVAVAVARGPLLLGVDAERVRSVRSAAAIASRRFHPAEAAHLAGMPEPALSREFLRMWSLKEAYGKAVGHGVAMSLSTCRTDHGTVEAPPPPGGGRWFAAVESPPTASPGQSPGHVFALVVGAPPAWSDEITAEIHYGEPGVAGSRRSLWIMREASRET